MARLCDISAKDKPWDIHRGFSDLIADLYFESYGVEGYQHYFKQGQRMLECAQTLTFAHGQDEAGNKSLLFRSTRFCRVRQCSVCQWRRSLYWKARMYQAIPDLAITNPGGRWLFLTLTTRNCFIGDLRTRIQTMNKAFKRMTLRKEFKCVKGWVKSLEVTRAKDGTAHPHFHILLFVSSTYFKPGNYLTQVQWQQLWKDSARLDYDPVVDVRAVKAKEKGKDALSGAVAETLKYAVKSTDLIQDRNWFLEYVKQMHKVRAIGTGGVLKDVFKEEPEEEDLMLQEGETLDEEMELEPTIDFDWNYKSRHYEN